MLDFTKKENELLDDFDAYFQNLVTTFNEFPRPEFAKIKLISKKRYEADLEEEARLKKLNI